MLTSSASSPDKIEVTIEADYAVVRDLRELEASFAFMLMQVKRLLDRNKCDLSRGLLFLESVIGSKAFIGCDNFDKLMRQLQRDHIDVFNVSILQQLVAWFDNPALTQVIGVYNEKKEMFLKQTTLHEFQRAVVSRVEPILANGMVVLTIAIAAEMASLRTLRDMEILAMEGFEEHHKKFIHVQALPGGTGGTVGSSVKQGT